MARLRIAVEFSDGRSAEYRVTPKVEVEFERQRGLGLPKAFTDQRREDIYLLAWLSHKASGEGPKPFNEWLDDLVDVELLTDGERPFTGTQPRG